MKKIIMAVAVAVMAVASNAAVCTWASWGGLYEMGTSNGADGYLVYFFDNAAYSRSAAETALAAGDFSFLSKGFEAEYLSSAGDVELNDAGAFGNGYTVDSYMVVFNAGTTADATFAYVSAENEMASGITGLNGQAAYVEFGEQTGMQTASNWQAVPEPTSGLLLLLGVAGIALKRKRA